MTLEPTLVMRQIPSVLLLMLSSLTNKVSMGTVRDDHSSEPYGTGWDIGAVLPIRWFYAWFFEVLIFSGFYTQLLKFAFITAKIITYLISSPQFKKFERRLWCEKKNYCSREAHLRVCLWKCALDIIHFISRTLEILSIHWEDITSLYTSLLVFLPFLVRSAEIKRRKVHEPNSAVLVRGKPNTCYHILCLVGIS